MNRDGTETEYPPRKKPISEQAWENILIGILAITVVCVLAVFSCVRNGQ